jgi:hypothetical protein
MGSLQSKGVYMALDYVGWKVQTVRPGNGSLAAPQHSRETAVCKRDQALGWLCFTASCCVEKYFTPAGPELLPKSSISLLTSVQPSFPNYLPRPISWRLHHLHLGTWLPTHECLPNKPYPNNTVSIVLIMIKSDSLIFAVITCFTVFIYLSNFD